MVFVDNRQNTTSHKSIFHQLFFVFGTLFLLLLGLFIALFFRTEIPNLNSYVGTQATVVTFADGTEMGRFASENRIEVPLMRIPIVTQKAVLAAEDQGFYTHAAFSPSAILRAFINNVQGNETQGGSTITQQYVKIAYLSQEQSLERKLKELMIAIKLESKLTKSEILNNYLNAIYFGRGAYGIETAANQYFDKSAAALTLPESIVLASVIRSPGKYDPSNDSNNLRNLQARFARVAKTMRENQWITESEYRDLQFPSILERRNLNTFLGVTGYIMEEVRKELVSKGYKEDDISQGGLVITTTIDRDAQDAAEWAVAKETPRDAPEDLHVGLIAIKPGDGAILAMYGGSDYLKRQLNDATQSITQAGSTFKPFAIVAGLERGIPLSSVWDGRSPQIYYGAGAPYRVSNYGNSNFGRLPLLRATAYSVNTVFVRLAYRVGFKSIVDVAKRAGIPDVVEMLPTPSFVLGVSSPRVIDVANAFATFAAEGVRSKPYLVARISKLNGEALYRVKPETVRVFDKKVMSDLNYALRGVIRGGTASAALGSFPRPVAGKTGTSQNNASAWFTGYTPQLSASVALFRDDATEELSGIGGLNSVTGGSFPARIWNTFARKALEEKPIKYFSNPVFIGGTKAIDLINPSPKSSPSQSKNVPDKPKVPAIPRITAKPIPLPSVSAKKIP